MTARLVFDDLGRSFGQGAATVPVLAGINLVLEPGSFTALVGPSGCGKSTLLHIAAGLDTQYRGRFARTPANSVTACLFQQPRLLPWLTARKNIAFVLESHGVGRAEVDRRTAEMLALVGLSGAADRFPSELSGGMQQRTALARALAVDPDFLLMDEPFSALDELTAAQLREEVLALDAQKDRTILFVTHNVREACTLADRIIVLNRRPGTIVADLAVDLPKPRAPDSRPLVELAERVLGFIGGNSAQLQGAET
jgi:NitT/TauT family transport system ATP-binding protein